MVRALPEVEIRNLWNGISVQPGWMKFTGQVDDALNVDLEVGKGAGNRPPSVLLANLAVGNPPVPYLIPGNWYKAVKLGGDTIVIGKDAGGAMKVFAFNAAGASLAIADPGGIGYAYLGADPDQICLAAAQDTVLVLNRTVVTAMQAAGAGVVLGSKTTYDDLPAAPAVNDIWKVKTDWNAFPAGHYKCTSAAPVVWVRIAEPGQANAVFDASKMPHRLIRNGGGGYDWGRPPWPDRLSGDDLLNPYPKWVGMAIRSMRFHLGRLFLNNRLTIKSSRGGSFLDLWINNVNKVGDADPVSVDVTAGDGVTDPGELLWSASCGSTLALGFAGGLVTEFTALGNTLTSINGQQRFVKAITPADVEPAADGSRLYVLDSQGAVHLFEYNDYTYALRYSEDVSQHVFSGWLSEYTVKALAVGHGALHVLTTTDLLIYRLGVSGRKVVQSAWRRYHFPGTVKFLTPVADHLEILLDSPGGAGWFSILTLAAQRVNPGAPMVVDAYLDLRESLEGTYDAGTNETTFTTGAPSDGASEFTPTRLVVSEVMGSECAEAGRELTPVFVSAAAATFAGRWDYPEERFVADGATYQFDFRFSVTSSAQVSVLLNDVAIDLLTWNVTFPAAGASGGQVLISKIADASAIPAGADVKLRRTVKARHYVGRLYLAELVFSAMYVSGGDDRGLVKQALVFTQETTDYVVLFEAPGVDIQESPYEVDQFNVLELDTDRARSKSAIHLIYGPLQDGRLRLRHNTAGQVIWSRAVLSVDPAVF